ncbi:hypothetical protein K443DRAFT_7509 [Laccaria amethystina LaAM-08-1]|uniref:Uncharacterized protein n=1 Tax=Laccaria amethystina LaAM-08-1 TaxID=1095629 RepID=A0A0C9WQM8_9AGAR|nr:hypothetical protein K443DRAFT_7509 [Laccaria amethystina LaAM-08-1]
MGNNYCCNKPLHHEGFVSHSNYTRHITLTVGTFRMLTKHVGLLPHRLLSFSHHHHTSFQQPPHIRTSFKHLTAWHMAPKSKKTTPAESRKRQASNADQQPVKRSRRGQNDDDNNQEETAAEQWADFEDQAMKTKGKGGRGGNQGRVQRAPAQRKTTQDRNREDATLESPPRSKQTPAESVLATSDISVAPPRCSLRRPIHASGQPTPVDDTTSAQAVPTASTRHASHPLDENDLDPNQPNEDEEPNEDNQHAEEDKDQDEEENDHSKEDNDHNKEDNDHNNHDEQHNQHDNDEANEEEQDTNPDPNINTVGATCQRATRAQATTTRAQVTTNTNMRTQATTNTTCQRDAPANATNTTTRQRATPTNANTNTNANAIDTNAATRQRAVPAGALIILCPSQSGWWIPHHHPDCENSS